MAGMLLVFVSADSSLSTQSFFVSSHNASPKERGKALHDEPKTVGREKRLGGREGRWNILVSLAAFRTCYGMPIV